MVKKANGNMQIELKHVLGGSTHVAVYLENYEFHQTQEKSST